MAPESPGKADQAYIQIMVGGIDGVVQQNVAGAETGSSRMLFSRFANVSMPLTLSVTSCIYCSKKGGDGL
jgi:hypothetical protein